MLKQATEPITREPSRRGASTGAARCRRKFLRIFPEGFSDETYLAWEREYKVAAHRRWQASLARPSFEELLRKREWSEIARAAVAIESRTNLLFSFEKMALRDAVAQAPGARAFAEGLFAFLYGNGPVPDRFEAWRDVVATLPRRQTRVLTWPVLTVFPFIAEPRTHMYLKPLVTRRAAERYGFAFEYGSKPQWATYESLLAFAHTVSRDLRDLRPRDQIDIQSFIWVQGSDEYA
jgi:integrase